MEQSCHFQYYSKLKSVGWERGQSCFAFWVGFFVVVVFLFFSFFFIVLAGGYWYFLS